MVNVINIGRYIGEAPQNVTSFFFFFFFFWANVVGMKVNKKHARCFSFGVYKEKETRKYDFKVQSQVEALEIVGEVKKWIERSRLEVGM